MVDHRVVSLFRYGHDVFMSQVSVYPSDVLGGWNADHRMRRRAIVSGETNTGYTVCDLGCVFVSRSRVYSSFVRVAFWINQGSLGQVEYSNASVRIAF